MGNPLFLQDWTLIQSFLAVAETGSLSAAAERLGRSQPTLGRQIHNLETALDTQLFDRHARGLRLSDTGVALLPHAEAMAAALGRLTMTAAALASDLAGPVRITASVYLSHYVLPRVIAQIRQHLPDVQIELAPSDDSESLHFREADIAIRMYRPTQLDLIARHVADIDIGVFAATSYLERAGRPVRIQDLLAHDLIGFDRNDLILRLMQQEGYNVARESFAVRCDNQAIYLELVRAGCGIGFSQVPVGLADPLLERLDIDLAIPPLPVWLTAHEKTRQTPRVRAVWEQLARILPPACRTGRVDASAQER